MSRLGKKTVPVPDSVQIKIESGKIEVKGPKGSLSLDIPYQIDVIHKDNQIQVKAKSSDKKARALHGTIRQLINNMIIGVTQGFKKELEIVGTGYRAIKQGNTLVLQVGFSHPVKIEPPPGVSIDVEEQNRIIVSGIDKQKVGQVAADIRSIRPPEPYKGKGIRYVGEFVRRKAGKAGIKAK